MPYDIGTSLTTQVSGVIDTFEDITVEGMSAVRKRVEQRAIDKAVAAGADPLTTAVVESEAIPIACESRHVTDLQLILIKQIPLADADST